MAVIIEQPPEWVANYIGIPFKDLGRTREGCDCWGLVRLLLMERASIQLPSHADDYKSEKNCKAIQQTINNNRYKWREVHYTDATTYDVAEMQLPVEYQGRYIYAPIHVGILVNKSYLLHTSKSVGSHIVNVLSKDVNIKGFWRCNAS